MAKFWKFTNLAQKERELIIGGTIEQEKWFDGDVTPDDFKHELMSGDGDVKIRINSPGGDVIAASQIYTMLKEYSGYVTVLIDGMAASAASVIAMAGDKVIMSPTAVMMIHDPSTVAMGNEADMDRAIGMLKAVKESIINAYHLKTELSKPKLAAMMSAETWMDAKMAIALGFADEMLKREGEEKADNKSFAFSRQKIVALLGGSMETKEEEPPKEPERFPVDSLLARLDSIRRGM